MKKVLADVKPLTPSPYPQSVIEPCQEEAAVEAEVISLRREPMSFCKELPRKVASMTRTPFGRCRI
jgi:hypothetical protein